MTDILPNQTIYHYDAQSGEFLMRGQADPNPKETDTGLLPAHATAIPVPDEALAEGYLWVFAEGAWHKRQDNRGQAYYLPNGEHYVISTIGETRPAEAMHEPPDLRSLTEAKAEAKAEITAAVEKKRIAAIGTDLMLQIETYRLKAHWAERVLNNSGDNEAQTRLQPEAEARQLSVTALARLIRTRAAHFETQAAALEALRTTALQAIDATENNSQCDAARQRSLHNIAAFTASQSERQ